MAIKRSRVIVSCAGLVCGWVKIFNHVPSFALVRKAFPSAHTITWRGEGGYFLVELGDERLPLRAQ